MEKLREHLSSDTKQALKLKARMQNPDSLVESAWQEYCDSYLTANRKRHRPIAQKTGTGLRPTVNRQRRERHLTDASINRSVPPKIRTGKSVTAKPMCSTAVMDKFEATFHPDAGWLPLHTKGIASCTRIRIPTSKIMVLLSAVHTPNPGHDGDGEIKSSRSKMVLGATTNTTS